MFKITITTLFFRSIFSKLLLFSFMIGGIGSVYHLTHHSSIKETTQSTPKQGNTQQTSIQLSMPVTPKDFGPTPTSLVEPTQALSSKPTVQKSDKNKEVARDQSKAVIVPTETLQPLPNSNPSLSPAIVNPKPTTSSPSQILSSDSPSLDGSKIVAASPPPPPLCVTDPHFSLPPTPIHKGDLIGYEGASGLTSVPVLSLLYYKLDSSKVTPDNLTGAYTVDPSSLLGNNLPMKDGTYYIQRETERTGVYNASQYNILNLQGIFKAPVYSLSDGNIILNSYYGDYGQAVVVQHPDCSYIIYAHLIPPKT